MTPYYEHGGITIYHGDCREILPLISSTTHRFVRHDLRPIIPVGDVLVTDPPYGVAYKSGRTGHNSGAALPGIAGDDDTSLRDEVLTWWGDRPAIVFGTWKRQKPLSTKAVLTWEKGDHVGMGDLSMPWKPNTEEVYVLGTGFAGHRGSSVLRCSAPVSWNTTNHGRTHAHEKPVALMTALLLKCPRGLVLDPFMGSGSTLVAAKTINRRAIGIEIEESYCEIAAKRLAQGVLNIYNEVTV